jgi:hypothetical protein
MLDGPPVRFNEVPAHRGPLFAAVATGNEFTMTVVVTEFWQPLELVMVNVYTPVIAKVAPVETVGLCRADTKLFGPVHE